MSSPEIFEELKSHVHQQVYTGFYSLEEIIERTVEHIEDGGFSDNPADIDEQEAVALIREEWAKKLKEEQSWPAQTMCDRLSKAFEQLTARGIISIENAGYTTSDGWATSSVAQRQVATALCLSLSALFIFSLSCIAKTKYFSIRNDKGYPHYLDQMQNLVQNYGQAKVNHISVLGEQFENGYRLAWVYWPEGRRFILWEPTEYTDYPCNLAMSRRNLDLLRDFVPTDNDIRGSTYLMSKTWLKDWLGRCQAHGDKFVIYRKSSWKPPIAHLNS